MNEPYIPACMGGFCALRDSCRQYHAEHREHPAERLCSPGTHDCWRPVELPQRERESALEAA